MNEIENKIFNLICKGVTIENIKLLTNLDYKEIYKRINFIKNRGYNISNKYLYNGKIIYYISNTLENNKEKSIEINPEINEIDFVIISDLHLCSEKERIDLLYNVYNFCDKEDIHFVINAGDVLSGLLGKDKKFINNFNDQINYAIDYYPLHNNIITFVCFGNHDFHSFKMIGLDSAKVICDERHDIINLGYGFGNIKILDDSIYIAHGSNKFFNNQNKINNNKFIIYGGGHKFKMSFNSNFVLYAPTLSDLKFTDDEILPGFIKAKLTLNNNKIKMGFFDHYLASTDKFYKLSSFIVDFKRNFNENKVLNEENKILTLKK